MTSELPHWLSFLDAMSLVRRHVVSLYVHCDIIRGGVEVQHYSFLTATLDSGDWLTSKPVCFIPGINLGPN